MVYMFTGWLHRTLTTLLYCRLLCIENGLHLMQEACFDLPTEDSLLVEITGPCRDYYSR